MKLSKWAKQQGISYTTAWRWFKNNKLPVKAIKTSSGTILVEPAITQNSSSIKKTSIYARVSSNDKKEDLKTQARGL